MRPALLIVVACGGCGFQITSGSSGGDGGATDATADAADDGTLDDGHTIDGPIDAMTMDGPITATCMLDWLNHTIQFDNPTAITPLNTTSFERDPFLSPDELTIWFSNGGPQSLGGADVFVSTRATRALPFGPPIRDARFSTTGGAETKMSMTLDGLYAVLASNVSGGSGNSDIWETSRLNLTGVWNTINRTHVSGLDTANNEVDPFVTPEGLRLYYAPVEPSPQHIVVATRTALNDSFGAVADVALGSTTSANGDPMVFGNERVIVFYSTRPMPGTGDTSVNLWYATRSSTSDAFGTPAPVPNVNTAVADADPHVSADGCRIYFARNVGGGVSYELFSASAGNI